MVVAPSRRERARSANLPINNSESNKYGDDLDGVESKYVRRRLRDRLG